MFYGGVFCYLFRHRRCATDAAIYQMIAFARDETGIACVLLSVLENESGYDDGNMDYAIGNLRTICPA